MLPDLFAFTGKQTDCEQKYEMFACEEYLKIVKQIHQTFKKKGLFTNLNWPFIGASPDGIIDCCGKGTIELNIHTVTKQGVLSKQL